MITLYLMMTSWHENCFHMYVDSPHQGSVTLWSVGIFYVVSCNKLLSKQSNCRFEMPNLFFTSVQKKISPVFSLASNGPAHIYVSPLVQIMVCCLCGTKPLSELMCWIDVNSIRPSGTNFSENLTSIPHFSYDKMHLNISSAECQPYCSYFCVYP